MKKELLQRYRNALAKVTTPELLELPESVKELLKATTKLETKVLILEAIANVKKYNAVDDLPPAIMSIIDEYLEYCSGYIETTENGGIKINLLGDFPLEYDNAGDMALDVITNMEYIRENDA